MTDVRKEMSEEAMEGKASKTKGASKPQTEPAPAAESGGLADLAKDDEPEEEEDVPF